MTRDPRIDEVQQVPAIQDQGQVWIMHTLLLIFHMKVLVECYRDNTRTIWGVHHFFRIIVPINCQYPSDYQRLGW